MDRKTSQELQARIMRSKATEQVGVLKDLNTWEVSMEQLEEKSQPELVSFDKNNSAKLSNDKVELNKCHHQPYIHKPHPVIVEASKPFNTVKPPIVQLATNPILVDATVNSNHSIQNSIGKDEQEKERMKGNKFYEDGKFQKAIDSYTRCLVLNKFSCCVCFSNRGRLTYEINSE